MKLSEKSLLLIFLLVSGVIGIWLIYPIIRPSRSIHASAVEVSVTGMVHTTGLWCQAGHTNGFTGVILETYRGGVAKSRSSVSNGLLEGVSFDYFTNGLVQVEQRYVAGVSDGIRTKWHANGRKLSQGRVVKGKLEGTLRSWDEQGMLIEEMELRDGLGQGLARLYYPSGFIMTEARLIDGKPVEQKNWRDGEQAAAPSVAGSFRTGHL